MAGGFEGDMDGTPASSLEGKRRNKLGYHRTAVACVHCRRRKIRCIPSQDAAEQRCQNCIRLRKECNYHAVDQGAATVTRRSHSAPGLDETTWGQGTHSSPPTPDVPTTFTQETLEDTEFVEEVGSRTGWSGDFRSQQAINVQSAAWNAIIPQPGPQLLPSNLPTMHTGVPYYTQTTNPSTTAYVHHSYPYAHEPPLHAQNAQTPYIQPNMHQPIGGPGHQYTESLTDNAAQMHQYYPYSEPSFPQLERSMTMPSTYSQDNMQSDPLASDQYFSPLSIARPAPTGYWQNQQTAFRPSGPLPHRGRQGRHSQNPG